MGFRFGSNTPNSGIGPGSANDGLSVTGVVIKLGQASGGSGAQLLEDREIPMNGFVLNFLGSAPHTGVEIDNAGDVQLTGFLGVGGAFSPNAYTFFFGTPNNFGTVYPGHGVADQFYMGWQRFDGVNTYPRPNVVGQWWAYNYSTGGSTIQALEAGFGYRTETDFDLNFGGQDYFELHQPEIAVPSGLTIRPHSFYVSKSTASVIHQGQIQNINYNTKNENETYFGWAAVTSGGPPDTDRILSFTYSAKGNNASITTAYGDQAAIFAPGSWNWDRGTLDFGISDTGSSLNNKVIQVFGNIRQRGTTDSGVSFIQTFSNADRPTEFSAQLFADTFSNNPTYIFDRRLANGNALIGDGHNGGEVSWTGGGNLNISGIAHGIGGGVNQCYDLHISAIDPADNILKDNLVIINDGNTTLRGGLKTGDPGSGSGLWELGKVITAASVFDGTRYVETKIDGVLVKLALVS